MRYVSIELLNAIMNNDLEIQEIRGEFLEKKLEELNSNDNFTNTETELAS
ncbi:hypothetical protein ACSW8S_18130 (plasmid) [Clostridium perfringens]